MEVHGEWFFSNQSGTVLIHFIMLHVKKKKPSKQELTVI